MSSNRVRLESEEGNRLLTALPAVERAAIEPHLQHEDLAFGRVLHETDHKIERVYFPHSGVMSAVKEFADGGVIEVATIGLEGVVGNSVVLDSLVSPNRVLAQVGGEGVSIESARLPDIFASCPTLHRLFLRYSQALFQQVAQTAACNRAHSVDERCARWLLMTRDRVSADSFTLTQEFLAQMLGVHRPSVSTAAGILQKAGLITYVRGRITILDRKALERSACECYGLINRHYENYLARV